MRSTKQRCSFLFFCSLNSKEKGRPHGGRVYSRAATPVLSSSFTFCYLSFICQDRKSSRKTCLTFIPRFFFNFLWNEYEYTVVFTLCGSWAPTGSFGEPHSFLRMQSVDTGVPSGSSERPTVDGVALSLELYYIYNYGFLKENNIGIASRTQRPVWNAAFSLRRGGFQCLVRAASVPHGLAAAARGRQLQEPEPTTHAQWEMCTFDVERTMGRKWYFYKWKCLISIIH